MPPAAHIVQQSNETAQQTVLPEVHIAEQDDETAQQSMESRPFSDGDLDCLLYTSPSPRD